MFDENTPFEVELDAGEAVGSGPIMRGRLRSRLAMWSKVVTSTLVLSWIAEGFPLRWVDQPPAPRYMRNHPSALQHHSFVTTAVAELVKTHVVSVVHTRPLVVSPLGVVPKRGESKYRLIFDGRYINDHLVIPTFKYETLSCIPDWAQLGDYCFTVDLTAGFHHLELHPDSIPYMGFQWNGVYYVYNCSPFGIATAPWAFTLLIRGVLNFLRKQGHRCASYIDDSIYLHQCSESLAALQTVVLDLFANLGLLVNFKKSQLDIMQVCIYLGMQLDLQRGLYVVPVDKKEQLLALLRVALTTTRNLHVRDLARIKGKIASMGWAFGIAAKLFTRAMDRDIAKAMTWNSTVQLSQAAIDEMQFWQRQFDRFNGIKPMWVSDSVQFVLHVDAAGRSKSAGGGWGAWCDVKGEQHSAHGQWQSAADSSMSSTAQELQACLFALQSFRGLMPPSSPHSQHSVQVVTDSMNVVHALVHGDVRATDSVKMAQEIFLYSFAERLHISYTWVPREKNTVADALSKLVDKEDCMLNPDLFAGLAAAFGPFSVDLFASQASRQLSSYHSKHFTPDTLGVDAFSFDWQIYGMCWAYPPFRLIAQVLRHSATCHARLCLLVPVWVHKPWWLTLVPDSAKFAPFVKAYQVVEPSFDTLLVLGQDGVWCPKGKTSWKMVAVVLDFSTTADVQQRLKWS